MLGGCDLKELARWIKVELNLCMKLRGGQSLLCGDGLTCTRMTKFHATADLTCSVLLRSRILLAVNPYILLYASTELPGCGLYSRIAIVTNSFARTWENRQETIIHKAATVHLIKTLYTTFQNGKTM